MEHLSKFMNSNRSRRIIIIVLAAILFVLVIGFLWYLFFWKGGAGGGATTGGEFGSGAGRSATSTRGTQTNIPNDIGGAGRGTATRGDGGGTTGAGAGAQTNIPLNADGTFTGITSTGVMITGTLGSGNNFTGTADSGAYITGTIIGNTFTGTLNGQILTGTIIQSGTTGGTEENITIDGGGQNIVTQTPLKETSYVPYAQWLGPPARGGSGNDIGGGGSITTFVPRTADQLNQSGTGGTVSVLPGGMTQEGQRQSGNLGLGLGILGATAGACLASQVFGVLGGTGQSALEGAAALGVGFVLVYDINSNRKLSQNQFKDLQDCLTRTIAKAALQQMTASIVNWINSGYQGKPSFVTNYERFFTNVADQAASEFIRGSALSFMCSPFQLQVRIAVAQSYARRSAPSCTLSGVIRNINGFMNGDFSQGGWQGLLSFTTMPTNNPYGAYFYAQAGLQTAQQNAVNKANRNLSPGGFIAVTKEKNCRLVNGSRVCDREISTPGKIVESSLETTLQTSFHQLELANYFDEIISAMIQQLMTRSLTQGLSTLGSGGSGGYQGDYLTPEQQQAQAEGQALLTRMQGSVVLAQQFGAAAQGSIADLSHAQGQLQQLVNCWETASSTATSMARQLQAAQNAAAAFAEQNSLNSEIDGQNAQIVRANSAIAKLQDLQTRVLYIASMTDVESVAREYAATQARGEIMSQTDVTQTLQDRAALQSRMAALNQQTAAELQRCNAFR